MGIFGWSYPPGCSSLPDDEDYPCGTCGKFEDKCICPECPECGTVGDPRCYIHHGMKYQQAQIDSLKEEEEFWAEKNRIENEAYNQEIEI